MALKLKPLNEQTMVITGGTSGIGLSTARQAAARGARLVVAARSEPDLRQLEEEINQKGGQCVAVVADVGDRAQVRQIAEAALSRFGGFDTWVNNAGVSIWGRLDKVSDEDSRQLFQTTFWGIVNGSLVAIEELKRRGGALINLGSLASDRAFPLQGMYCAAKHAVKGFTDTLRLELEEQGAPVSVTLIKPAGIDTPFPEHAKKYQQEEAVLPPPVYMPDDVADAILYAATRPSRDLYVGGASRFLSSMGRIAPRATDRMMEATMFDSQKGDRPARNRAGSLHQAGHGLRERGDHPGFVHHSLYTRAALHPWLTGLVLGAAGVAVAGAIGAAAGREHHS